MSKVNIGDYVYVDYRHKNGTVIGDRGGYVGRWTIKFDDGETGNASSRDCTIIRPSTPPPYLTIEQKLDLLLDHLGLRIEVEPQVVKVVKDEEASD